jgi:ApaG protein
MTEERSSEAVTRGVRVEVESFYDADRSAPQDRYYFFAYRVRITNGSGERVQLLRRHWRITDADGSVQDVEGPGVVGRQPVLEPGQSFEYTSFCPLRTPLGWMEGEYELAAAGGEKFSAAIGRFTLEVPHAVN